MKLIYIVNQRLPIEKAYSIQIVKMCEAFALKGLDVVLLFPSRKNPSGKTVFEYYGVKNNFKAVKLPTLDFHFPGRLDRWAVNIKNLISGLTIFLYVLFKKSDIIFSRDELPLYFLSFFKENLVFEAHKFSSRRIGFYRRFKKAGFKIVTISKGLRDEFIKFGYEPERVLVAHDGVDLHQFNVSLSEGECRNKVGLPKDKKIIGYVGQLKTMGMEKGIGSLIQAVGGLSVNHPDILLVIVGGSDIDLKSYQSFAQEKGMSDKVLFLGWKKHEDIPYYLGAFDVLAMPFPNKPHYALYMSPLKLFEYMASGRPIVATDLPTVREVLNPDNSVLVEPDNDGKFARGVELVLTNPELSKRISAQALNDVENYTWNARATKVLEFIK